MAEENAAENADAERISDEEVLYGESDGQEEAEPTKEKAAEGTPEKGEAEKPADESQKTIDDKGEKQDEISYAEFTVPEGMVADKETMATFTELAKESGLTQESAQKLVDMATQNVQNILAAQDNAYAETRQEWKKLIEKDPELGGAKLNETQELCQLALRKFGDDSLTELLGSTGIGDSPALTRLLKRVGKMLSEDTLVDGDSGIKKDEVKSTQEVLYGTED